MWKTEKDLDGIVFDDGNSIARTILDSMEAIINLGDHIFPYFE